MYANGTLKIICLIGAVAAGACDGSNSTRHHGSPDKEDAGADHKVTTDIEELDDAGIDAPVDVTDDQSAPDQSYTPGTFGQTCSSAEPCEIGANCFDATPIGGGGGFCTTTCSTKGVACADAPADSRAFCSLEMMSGTLYCAFLCKSAGGVVLSCPPELRCGDHDQPAGSGQHFCIPGD